MLTLANHNDTTVCGKNMRIAAAANANASANASANTEASRSWSPVYRGV